MKKYEYKFAEVTAKRGLKDRAGENFDEWKDIIIAEAENGWRLKQVVIPFHKRMSNYG